ncbi:hypothetical protein HDK90DRAFT_114762 [Phyllosticta capitalensis]|uniref:DUF7924 domain-containing protein n=1 Tax=Phyllosticta capitalensis TaxID=121624 RepID=A0ABR1YAD5_9PEZI
MEDMNQGKDGLWNQDGSQEMSICFESSSTRQAADKKRKRRDDESSEPSLSSTATQSPSILDNNSVDNPHPLDIFLKQTDSGPSDESRRLYNELLQTDQPVPSVSLFDDRIFEKTISKLEDKNKARVIKDIDSLIVASAEEFETLNNADPECLVETVDVPWTTCVSLCEFIPRPRYTVAYHWKALGMDRLALLDPKSPENPFRVSPALHFPFLSCEVTSRTEEDKLSAHRCNGHSAAIAMKGVVELFRRAKRGDELHREVIFFSIIYDSQTVNIFGHFVEINGAETEYCRVLIKHNNFKSHPENKWLSYKFTKNLYESWAPMHLEHLYSAIDSLGAISSVPIRKQVLWDGLPAPEEYWKFIPFSNHDNIDYWRENQTWPPYLFEHTGTTMEDLLQSLSKKDPESKRAWDLVVPELEQEPSEHLESEDSEFQESSGSSDARRRLLDNQEAQEFLQNNSTESSRLSNSAKDLIRRLVETEQTVPYTKAETDKIFTRVASQVSTSKRGKIIADIMPILVPRSDQLYSEGDDSLKYLGETVNEPWTTCISIHKSYHPRPYYAAGFDIQAISYERRLLLIELEREDAAVRSFSVTFELRFPFFIAEPPGEHAHQRNVANALIAMRSVIELFRCADRAHELDGEILAFSAVFEARSVRVCAHVAGIPADRGPLCFYCHEVFSASFPDDGWKSYKFVKNIYKVWAPMHFARICSVIEDLEKCPTRSSQTQSEEGRISVERADDVYQYRPMFNLRI